PPETFSLDAEEVVVIGVGNVAVDVVRIMARSADELRGTDIPEEVLRRLAASRVRRIHMIGRRGPQHAKFTLKELRELGELENADVLARADELAVGDLTGLSRQAAGVVAGLLAWSRRLPAGRAPPEHG